MMDSAKIKESIIAAQSNVDEYKNGIIAPIEHINVIITQPRRMAAVSMANRVTYERGIL
jgi:HrpA-like RNA helicase